VDDFLVIKGVVIKNTPDDELALLRGYVRSAFKHFKDNDKASKWYDGYKTAMENSDVKKNLDKIMTDYKITQDEAFTAIYNTHADDNDITNTIADLENLDITINLLLKLGRIKETTGQTINIIKKY
jgi:hypothetical protein